MKKLLSVLLALAIVLSFATVFAGEEVTPPSDAGQETESVSPTGETQSLPRVDLKKQIVPREEVPDLIDYEVAVAEKYVCRAYWEETSLNEVVFLKADGSLARYVFSFPVKYEADGEVYDKKPELEARETLLANKYRYQLSAQNDTVLYCAENLADGFYFEGEGLQVNLRPITETEYNFLRGHIDADDFVTPIAPGGGFASSFVTYDSVAVTATAQSGLTADSATVSAPVYALSTQGEQAAFVAVQDRLAVVPSYTGFQVQLELAENFAPSTVYFELDPNGLALIREEDTLILVDRYGDAVGVVGDLLSSRGMAHDVAYDVIALDNGTYLLSATLPRTSGGIYTTSVVPVYDYLQDATIYNAHNKSYGQSANLWVGYYSGMGVERVLIRPNIWDFTEDMYPGYYIMSASVVLRDITATAPEETIVCNPFTGNYWNENSATWASVSGDSIGSNLDSKQVSADIGWDYGYYYSFDVTSLVRSWYNDVNGTVWPKGVAFRWLNETSPYSMEKCFASTQYSVEAYRPRIVVEYEYLSTIENGVYRIRNGSGSNYLTSGSSIASGTEVGSQGKLPDSSYRQLWRVHELGGGYYTIRPMHFTPSGLEMDGMNVTISEIGVYDLMEDSPSYVTWLIEATTTGYELSTFGNPELLARSSSNGDIYMLEGSDSSSNTNWFFEPVETVPCEVLIYNESTGALAGDSFSKTLTVGDNVAIGALGYRISMSMAGSINPADYSWQSSNPSVAELNSVKRIVVRNTGNTMISYSWYDTYNEPRDITIYLTCYPMEDGDYFIRNVKTGKYADIENQLMANGTEIHQWDFHGHWTQEWRFERYNLFFYTIKSTVSGTPYYMAMDGSSVVLKSDANGITNDMLWYISYRDDGSVKIAPMNGYGQGYVMAVAWDGTNQEQNGLNFIKQLYSDDAYDTDAWDVFVPYKLNVSVMVDYGYIQRYSGSGDTDYYMDRIANSMQYTRDFLMSQFRICVKFSEVAVFNSLADTCSSVYDQPCECEDGCLNGTPADAENCPTMHHKNMWNILIHSGLPDISEAAKLVFTGHVTCVEGRHDSQPYAGGAYPSYGNAIVCSFSSMEAEARTTLHEIGHLFYAPDHQKAKQIEELAEEYPGYTFDANCIYGANNTTSLCSGCQTIIQNNANRFVHD